MRTHVTNTMKPSLSQNATRSAVIALVILSLIWGYNWVVMKVALRDCGPFTFAALRAMLGAFVLLPLLPGRGGLAVPEGAMQIILLGLLQTTGFLGFAFWALVEGGAGKTSVLVYTMPFWVLIFARFFLGDRIRGAQWPAILFAFCGLTLIFDPWHARSGLFSQFLAVMAGISWGASVIVAKLLQKKGKIPLLQLTTWQMLFGAIPLVIIALIVPEVPIHWTPSFLAALFYNVVLSNAIAWFLWLFILEKLPAGVAGMGSLAIPLVGVLTAWLQLGEKPGIFEGAGMLLIGMALLFLAVHAIRSG